MYVIILLLLLLLFSRTIAQQCHVYVYTSFSPGEPLVEFKRLLESCDDEPLKPATACKHVRCLNHSSAPSPLWLIRFMSVNSSSAVMVRARRESGRVLFGINTCHFTAALAVVWITSRGGGSFSALLVPKTLLSCFLLDRVCFALCHEVVID